MKSEKLTFSVLFIGSVYQEKFGTHFSRNAIELYQKKSFFPDFDFAFCPIWCGMVDIYIINSLTPKLNLKDYYLFLNFFFSILIQGLR